VSTESIAAGGRARVDWRRAEFVLTLLRFLGFLTFPIRITTIYSGLPAHPLFVHVPVILIPTTVVAAVVFMIKATLIVTFAAQRISGGMPTGLRIVDVPLAPKSMFTALRVLLVLLSIGAGYMCFRTGDLGAKAVWAGRIQAAHAASPSGPGTPGSVSPSGTIAP
jgi:hypothetical protein